MMKILRVLGEGKRAGEVLFFGLITYHDDEFRDMATGGTGTGEKRTRLGLFRAGFVVWKIFSAGA